MFDIETVSKEDLSRLYLDERKSLLSIAKLYGTNTGKITRLFREFGIKTRSISQALTGVKLTPERAEKAKRNLAAHNQLKKLNGVSDEEKERLRRIKPDRNGIPHTEETKAKMRKAAVGRVNSDVAKAKMSATRLGNPKYSGSNHPLYGKSRPDITGEKHFNWNNGISALYRKIRRMTKYAEWRTYCFQRDNFTCVFCSRKATYLHVDHIRPFAAIVKDHNLTSTVEAQTCEELWNVNNGRTLCVPCHRKTDTYGRPHKQRV